MDRILQHLYGENVRKNAPLGNYHYFDISVPDEFAELYLVNQGKKVKAPFYLSVLAHLIAYGPNSVLAHFARNPCLNAPSIYTSHTLIITYNRHQIFSQSGRQFVAFCSLESTSLVMSFFDCPPERHIPTLTPISSLLEFHRSCRRPFSQKRVCFTFFVVQVQRCVNFDRTGCNIGRENALACTLNHRMHLRQRVQRIRLHTGMEETPVRSHARFLHGGRAEAVYRTPPHERCTLLSHEGIGSTLRPQLSVQSVLHMYVVSSFRRRIAAVHTLTATVATHQIVDRSINSIGTPNAIIDFTWSGRSPSDGVGFSAMYCFFDNIWLSFLHVCSKSNSVPCSKAVVPFHQGRGTARDGKSLSLTSSSLRRKVCDESILNRKTWTINDELYPTIRQGRREERLL